MYNFDHIQAHKHHCCLKTYTILRPHRMGLHLMWRERMLRIVTKAYGRMRKNNLSCAYSFLNYLTRMMGHEKMERVELLVTWSSQPTVVRFLFFCLYVVSSVCFGNILHFCIFINRIPKSTIKNTTCCRNESS